MKINEAHMSKYLTMFACLKCILHLKSQGEIQNFKSDSLSDELTLDTQHGIHCS